jgi:hypothetical protein
MQRSNYLTWFRRLVVLGAVVAGVSASTATAIPLVDLPDGGTAAFSAPVSRPPDVRDTATGLYAATNPSGAASQAASVGRPPDVADASLAVQYGSAMRLGSSGFDWSDWAIGIGSGLGLCLLVGGAVLMGRQLRHRVQPA